MRRFRSLVIGVFVLSAAAVLLLMVVQIPYDPTKGFNSAGDLFIELPRQLPEHSAKEE